ncbi:MAG TPA: arginine deiminase-related protein [Gemmatimonadales bacterium]|nr:arginine deiminase-related protein [Gemmatimonadales bacterium]
MSEAVGSAPSDTAASHVLLVEPPHHGGGFRYNRETAATNVFQELVPPEEESLLAGLAVEQHHRLRDLLVGEGVTVTITRSLEATPDGPFCNNWFSTHPAGPAGAATLVIYPLLAENRRPERRRDLIELLRPAYPRYLDLSPRERESGGHYLESTGSLVLDHRSRRAYAALSPRTDPGLASEWADALGYDLVRLTATDRTGVPYYHTNLLMFIGHGLAGVCLEAIESAPERRTVRERLEGDANEVLALTRHQVAEFCGNCLALASRDGEALWLMSSRARRGFSAGDLARIERHGRILHTELSAFERLGGGSARCLVGELF